MENENQNSEDKQKEVKEDGFERKAAFMMAVVAAFLVITELGNSKYEGDKNTAELQAAYMHDWYNAKGIKQNLAEAQSELLKALIESGSISNEKVPAIQKNIEECDANVKRYKKEKKEMKEGSSKVGQENWAQDIDGKLGLIIGEKEWQEKVDVFEYACNLFSVAILILQIGLILGATSILIKNLKVKKTFLKMIIIFGLAGLCISIYAFTIALSY